MMKLTTLTVALIVVLAAAGGAQAFRLDLSKMGSASEYGAASDYQGSASSSASASASAPVDKHVTPLDDSLDATQRPMAASDKTAPPAHQGHVFMCRITPKDQSVPVREYELSLGADQTQETTDRLKECQGGGSGRHAANLIEGHGDHSSDFNVQVDVRRTVQTHDILVTNNRYEAVQVDLEVAGDGVLANPPSPVSLVVDARANGKLITSLTRADVDPNEADKLPADVFSSEKDMPTKNSPIKGGDSSSGNSNPASASGSGSGKSASGGASSSGSSGSKIAASDASKSEWPKYTWKWKAEKVEFSQKQRTTLVSSNGVTVHAVHTPFKTLFSVDNARPHDVLLTLNLDPVTCRGSEWANLKVPAKVPHTIKVPGNKNFVKGYKPPANMHKIFGVEPVHKDKPWSFSWNFHWYSHENAPHVTFGVADDKTGELIAPAPHDAEAHHAAAGKKCNPKLQKCPDGMVRGTPKPKKLPEGIIPLPLPPVKFYPQEKVAGKAKDAKHL